MGLVPWGMRCGHHFGGSHRLVVISGHHCALDHSLVRVDRDVLYNDLRLSATWWRSAADEIGTSDQSQNGQSDRRRRAASFFAGRQVDRIISRMSHFGPSRHLPRCGDLVAIGGQADIARTSQIGRS